MPARKNLYQKSAYVQANITIAEQLMALVKKPGTLDQCSAITFQLSQIQDIEEYLQVPFYDLHLYIDSVFDLEIILAENPK